MVKKYIYLKKINKTDLGVDWNQSIFFGEVPR